MSNYEKVKNTISEIENILKSLNTKKMSNNEIENYFFDKHTDIMDTYPFLVTTLINNTDRKMLDYMLENLRLMESGTKSSHEADVDIGQKIVDDYVKPELKK
jgi:hypothetical protein